MRWKISGAFFILKIVDFLPCETRKLK